MIAQAFDSTSAVFKTCGSPFGAQVESVTDNLLLPSSEQSQAEDWHRNGLWVERPMSLETGAVFAGQQLTTDPQLERTVVYQHWTRRLDVFCIVGVLFPADKGNTGVLSVHRTGATGSFGDADLRQMRVLLPHMRRALGLRHRSRKTALEQSVALQAMGCIEAGILVVDASCTVLYANRAAKQILRSGREICMQGQRLQIEDPNLGNRLARLVREAMEKAARKTQLPGAALPVLRPGRLPITLLVSPWRVASAPMGLDQPAAMIFIRDPENSVSTAGEILRGLFGLTRTEAAIALAISQGHSPARIAADLCVGLGTVRTHLNQVLAKTATARQGALAALVARSVAGIALTPHPGHGACLGGEHSSSP